MSREFRIHPTDLARRWARCAALVERLGRSERVTVTACNTCGGERAAVLCLRDRYGFPGRLALCLNCGLFYNMDRLTGAGFAEFYASGGYRRLIGAFKNREQSVGRVRQAQAHYAETLTRTLAGLVPWNANGRVLDVGGSTGLVARAFQREFGHRPTVLEPAAAEAAEARSAGLEVVTGSLETWTTEARFEVILVCRTVEHLPDLKLALAKIRSLLRPGGLVYCDIADFLESTRREGPAEAVSRLDHLFWLTQETAPAIFRSAGLEVVSTLLTVPPDQAGFLLRAAEPEPIRPVAGQWIERTLRSLRQAQTDWNRQGARALDARDWLRQTAYRLKARFR